MTKLLPFASALWLVAVEPQSTGRNPPPTQIRSGTQLVQVAVNVNDREGRAVIDLSAGEFSLTERGSPLIIAFFDRVRGPHMGLAPGPPVNSAAGDVSTTVPRSSHRSIVLLLDDLHVAPQRAAAVKSIMKQFLEQHLDSSDVISVVSTGGRASVSQEFTTDRALVRRALDSFAGLKRTPSVLDTRVTMEALASVARHPASEGRRVTVLFVSEGIEHDIYNVLNPEATDVVTAIHQALTVLKTGNTVLYAIDPRGLITAEGEGIDTNAVDGNVTRVLGRTPVSTSDRLALSIQSLRHVAEATGGFAPRTNDYADAFRQIASAARDYYVLGFYPQSGGKHGEIRPLQVRVSRPGLRVSARQSYVVYEAGRDRVPPT